MLFWVIWVHEPCQVLFPNVPVITLESKAGEQLEMFSCGGTDLSLESARETGASGISQSNN